MTTQKLLKTVSLVLSVFLLVLAFTSCSANNQKNQEPLNIPQQEDYPEKSPLAYDGEETHIKPDLSGTVVKEATTKEYTAATEEDFVKALENFVNPNGNKYDALAVLGDYDYTEKGDELLSRFDDASKKWHASIVEEVGNKCVVKIDLKEKSNIDKQNQRVTDWETVNGIECEEYANIKCIISTNYAKNAITLSLDIVKINGNWHFATVSSIDTVKYAITTKIFE